MHKALSNLGVGIYLRNDGLTIILNRGAEAPPPYYYSFFWISLILKPTANSMVSFPLEKFLLDSAKTVLEYLLNQFYL